MKQIAAVAQLRCIAAACALARKTSNASNRSATREAACSGARSAAAAAPPQTSRQQRSWKARRVAWSQRTSDAAVAINAFVAAPVRASDTAVSTRASSSPISPPQARRRQHRGAGVVRAAMLLNEGNVSNMNF